MTDTEILIRCPFCLSDKVRELPGTYKTDFKMELPEGAAVEVRYPVYRCMSCGREFDERETS